MHFALTIVSLKVWKRDLHIAYFFFCEHRVIAEFEEHPPKEFYCFEWSKSK